MKKLRLPCLALAALACGAASAETLYKLIDRNGRVTYVQEKPRDFDGTVVPVEIDLKANTASMPKYATPAKPAEGEPRPAPQGSALSAAQARAQSARRAFEAARDNPGEADVRWVGNVKGGTRPVPSEDYLQRLARLENEMIEAERELRRLQGGR
jgi:hypothetical protein